MSLKRIVVAVDGSPSTERVLSVAEQLARSSGALLQIVCVVTPPHSYLRVTEKVSEPGENEAGYFRELLSRLESQAHHSGVRQVEHALLEGSPAEAILESLGAEPPDLLVVGSRGRTGTRRLLLGSVSNALVQVAPCPVLVVRPPPHGEDPGRTLAVRNISVAVDGSHPAELAVELGTSLAKALGGVLTLVTVIPPSPRVGPEGSATESERAHHAHLVEELRGRLTDHLKDVRFEIYEGSPADRLLEHTETHPSEILVVGSRGLSRTQRVLLGSVSQALVNHASVPVLVVRDREPAQAGRFSRGKRPIP